MRAAAEEGGLRVRSSVALSWLRQRRREKSRGVGKERVRFTAVWTCFEEGMEMTTWDDLTRHKRQTGHWQFDIRPAEANA